MITSSSTFFAKLCGASLLLVLALGAAPAAQSGSSPELARWVRGIENQRKADLGNGSYLNPILAGDHPDPSVVRVDREYYMVFSTFDAYPGLVVWHSRDLVNWKPIGPTLFKNVGPVWAPDIAYHDGRFYIYFPAMLNGRQSNYVIWADKIEGPWSDPVDLNIGQIDPGHAVGPDGRRYLFMSGGFRHELSADGLSVLGPAIKVYDGWKYPEDWVVSGFALEGPKVVRRGEYYYMIVAEGGTAGPPTAHMVVAARSKSIDGPWENSPYNPIVHTESRHEKWWSKGHATLVEGPDAKWYLVYHAYENGYYTLGRQTLLEPVEWTADGWFKSAVTDVSKPIPKPVGAEALEHGFAFSDDFLTNKIGLQWAFFNGSDEDMRRYRFAAGGLVIKGKGSSPRDCSPLSFITGDQSYVIEAEIELIGEATGGLLLFYNDKLYAGLGISRENAWMHRTGLDRKDQKPTGLGSRFFIRVVNDQQVLIAYTSVDGKTWQKYPTSMEVSAYHHNVAWGYLSLRPSLYATGTGEVVFRNFKYEALP